MTMCTLDELLKAISNAVSGSCAHLKQRHLDNHSSFFDADVKGFLAPKKLLMLLPLRHVQHTDGQAPETEGIHQIPQSTLVQQNQMELDSMTMEIDCLVEELKDGDDGQKQLVLSLGSIVHNRSNGIRLNLTYKNSGTPEGVARVNDELLKQF
jgi:hypothetical protein